MNDIEVSSIDLVEGGNVFKQGHYLTLGYVPRDEKGETVDLSGKTLNVSLWGRKGVVFEAAATYSAGVIRFTLDKMVPAGDYTVEFTVTSSTDAKYRKKFPTNQHSGRIAIKQSADDLGVVGIQVYTVAQLKAEQKAIQTQYESTVNAKVQASDAKSTTALTKSTTAEATANDVKSQFEQVVISGDSSVEAAAARVAPDQTFVSLKARLDAKEQATALQLADIAVNAKSFGLSETATWQANRDALQAANDFVYSKGGGEVLIPPGTYNIKGVMQDSHVKFILQGSTLKNPDGVSPSVLNSREYQTVGTSVANSNLLTVTNIKGLEVGTLVAIEGAGGILHTQQTTLAVTVDASTTSISLTGDDGKFPTGGYLRVGNELIKYNRITSKTVEVTKRGALGTVATTHSAGVSIGLAPVFYTEVVGVAGNTLTLKDALPISLSDTVIWFGAIDIAISGGVIDGNKVEGGTTSSAFNVVWRLTRWSSIKDTTIKNGDQGGIILERGATENTLDNIIFRDIGIYSLPTDNKGSGLWMFQACKRNKGSNLTFTGGGWVGCYIDDRTTIANQFDAPNEDNYITNFTVDFNNEPAGYNPGIIITGSKRNKFSNGRIKGPYTGIKIEDGSQFLGVPEHCKDNEVSSVTLDVRQPWNISTSGNRINNIVYSDKLIAQPVTDSSTLVYAVSPGKGQSATFGDPEYKDGMPSAPSITFLNDKDTGFLRYGSDTVGLSLGGTLALTFYPSLVRLKDGYTLETGTVTGTRFGNNAENKIGFYGKSPIAQQATLGNTSGLTLAQLETEMNLIKTALRNLGLVAMS